MKLGYVLLEHLFGVIHVLFRFSTLKNKFVKIVFPKTLKKCFRKHILCFRKYVITHPKNFILGANFDRLKSLGQLGITSVSIAFIWQVLVSPQNFQNGVKNDRFWGNWGPPNDRQLPHFRSSIAPSTDRYLPSSDRKFPHVTNLFNFSEVMHLN